MESKNAKPVISRKLENCENPDSFRENPDTFGRIGVSLDRRTG